MSETEASSSPIPIRALRGDRSSTPPTDDLGLVRADMRLAYKEADPELVCVNPESISRVWPLVSGLLTKAQERFGSNDERLTVEDDLMNGRALLWLAWTPQKRIEAALVTDIIKEDGHRICRMRALAGNNISRWIRLLTKIEKFARDEKCKCIRYFGRRGWTSMLGSDYRVTHVQAEKTLEA